MNYKTILSDGSTVGWYDSEDLTTIVKDESNIIEYWRDKLGSGTDLSAYVSRPELTVEGVDFNEAYRYLQTQSIVLNQPVTIYFVFKQRTWAANRFIMDGKSAILSGALYQQGTTPNVSMHGGGLLSGGDAPLNTWTILRMTFDGADSKIITNDNTPILGNAGSNNMGGLTVGTGASLSGTGADIVVKEIIVRSVNDTENDSDTLYQYLKKKYEFFFDSTILTLGDSETEGTIYPSVLGEVLGATILNAGIGGTRINRYVSNLHYDTMSLSSLSESMLSGDWTVPTDGAYNTVVDLGDDNRPQVALLAGLDYSTVDIITMFYGTNDYANDIPIGTNTDTAPQTFKGAINFSLTNAKAAYPNKKMQLITPTFRSRIVNGDGKDSDNYPNAIGVYLLEYVDAIIELGAIYGIPVYDAYRNSGINISNSATYLVDGLHFNEVGGELMGNNIAEQLRINF